MNPWSTLAMLAFACFASAVWLTGRVRAYAFRADLIDKVNARGSHAVATPRGGGLAIVLVTCIGLLAACLLGLAPVDITIALIGGGAVVAGIGWLDDHGHVSPILRLMAHAYGAAWVIYWLGPLPLDAVFGGWHPPAPLAYAITLLFLMWLINLYNFMDGIDGIAGGQAVSVTGCGAALLAAAGDGPVQVTAPLLLGAASLGFLVWNWPPARIFMGDVSSGFLGLALGALALGSARVAPAMPYVWIILSGVFIADATVTLLRRLLRRERVYEAHRSHAYQILARRSGAHLPVTAATLVINGIWCLPWAWAVATSALPVVAGLSIALLPLVVATLLAGAGTRDDGETINVEMSRSGSQGGRR